MSKNLCTMILIVLLLSVFNTVAPALDDSASAPVAKYGIKQIKTNEFAGYSRMLSWVKINETKSIAFAADPRETATSDTDQLNSFTLNKNGKASKSNVLLKVNDSRIAAAEAFWIDGMMPATGYGLLFVAYMQEKTYNPVIFAVARFDENGKLTTELVPFHEEKVEGDLYFSNMWLKGARRDGAIGLALGVNVSEYSQSFSGIRHSRAFFAEFSEEGFIFPPGVTPFKLPDQGDLKELILYSPIWNGASWLTPVVMTLYKEDVYAGRGYTDELGYDLSVLVARPKLPDGPLRMRVKRLYRDLNPIHWPTFVSPVFLPNTHVSAAGPLKGETVNLLFTRAAQAGNEGRGINAKKYSYFIQPVNDRGKKVGPSKTVAIPEWERLYTGATNLYSEETDSMFSNAYPAEDGRSLITLSRSASFGRLSDDAAIYESQFDWLVIDPSNGDVERRAQGNYKNQAIRSQPFLLLMNGAYSSLNTCVQEVAGKQSMYFYFSKLGK